MKIICREDCGNAPKKVILKDFHIALAKKDEEFILDHLHDHYKWDIIGDRVIHGKENMVAYIQQFPNVEELHIKEIITHGKTAAVHGSINGDALHFCCVYNFSSAGKNSKIKDVSVYIIKP